MTRLCAISRMCGKDGNARGVASNVHFFDHDFKESFDLEMGGIVNQQEARLIMDFVRYLLGIGYTPANVAVLTNWSKQIRVFKKLVSEDYSDLSQLGIYSLESFKKDQIEVLLFSFTYSDAKNLRDLLGLSQIMGLILSRASHGRP